MRKLSWINHEHHIEMLEEFYASNKYYLHEPLKDAILDAIECIRYADEQQKKQGRWIQHSIFAEWDVCSECGIGTHRRKFELGEIIEESYIYCPHCGAKMSD